jgi:hypothetical protein
MIAFLRSLPAAQGIRPSGYPYKYSLNVLAMTVTLKAKKCRERQHHKTRMRAEWQRQLDYRGQEQ